MFSIDTVDGHFLSTVSASVVRLCSLLLLMLADTGPMSSRLLASWASKPPPTVGKLLFIPTFPGKIGKEVKSFLSSLFSAGKSHQNPATSFFSFPVHRQKKKRLNTAYAQPSFRNSKLQGTEACIKLQITCFAICLTNISY